MNIDVVIPVRNSISTKNNSIYFTLKSILAQKGISFKVIIVDDGSKDETVSCIKKEFSKYSNIEVVQNPHSGVANARNSGARKGTGEYLLFIDDDTILPNYTILEEVLDFYHKYSFSCGATRYWTILEWPQHLLKEDTYRSWLNILSKISYIPKGTDRVTGGMDLTHVSFIGNFGMIQRKVFNSVNGYPESYTGWGMEDTHLMYVLCINGYDYNLFMEKNICVYHLNHKNERNETFLTNLEKFKHYQKERGLSFSEAAFFNEYDGISPVLRKY